MHDGLPFARRPSLILLPFLVSLFSVAVCPAAANPSDYRNVRILEGARQQPSPSGERELLVHPLLGMRHLVDHVETLISSA
jgi:hypothetical protein